MVKHVVEVAAKRVAVIAGAGSNSTREAVELTAAARAAGADAALLISPYYNKPTQEGIFQHYRTVASETRLPIVIYNIPGRTASRIEPETSARLSRVTGIAGLKECGGDFIATSETILQSAPSFAVLSGDDANTLPMLEIGARGVISTASNISPAAVVALVRAHAAGDHARARQLHYELLPLCQALFVETNPIGVKTARSDPRPDPERGDAPAADRDREDQPRAPRGGAGRAAPRMKRVLIVGAGGRMGDALLRALGRSFSELRLGAALEYAGHPRLGAELEPGVKLGSDPRAACAQADVAIDFSSPESTMALLEVAEARGLPLVIGTTGIREEGEARIARAAERVPIVRAANFSIGIAVLLDLVAEAARRLEGYQIDVLEMHHDQKLDAPSGTALALARSAAAARGQDLQQAAVYARQGQTGKRDPAAIGLQALRLGDSVGEHTVYFAGPGERVELAHRAFSRDNFAAGALRAAAWVIGRTPGLYGMRDVLG